MPSIVDIIAKTEEEAEAIRKEAQAKAKSIVEAAEADMESAVQEAAAEVRKNLVLRRENANNTAEKLRIEILTAKRKEAETTCLAAEKDVDKAAKYIIERLSV